jgi:hypothetical protein
MWGTHGLKKVGCGYGDTKKHGFVGIGGHGVEFSVINKIIIFTSLHLLNLDNEYLTHALNRCAATSGVKSRCYSPISSNLQASWLKRVQIEYIGAALTQRGTFELMHSVTMAERNAGAGAPHYPHHRLFERPLREKAMAFDVSP